MTRRACAICGTRVRHSLSYYCSYACRDARHGTLEERFWAKVDKHGPDECWPWKASRVHGYGSFSVGRKMRVATHVSWELENQQPVPEGMLVCHKCDNPACVNPAHLWVGSHLDNNRDASSKGRLHGQRKTHCPQGHEYTPENTQKAGTRRQCRQCNRARVRLPLSHRRTGLGGMMTHEQHAVSTEEFVDFLTDALIDSTGPDWTCSDGAWAIARQLATEGRLDRVLEAFDPPKEQYRIGPSVHDGMRASVEVYDGAYSWRLIASCAQSTEAKFVVRALNAYAAIAAGTRSAETGETPAPSEGCQSVPKGSPND